MKIRISHFGSSACLLFLAILFSISPPFVMVFLQSDASKQNVEDVAIFVYIYFYVVSAFLLYSAVWELKYYILNQEGISIYFLGVVCRQVRWESIFDVMIGPDPFQKYTTKTLLLNCQPGRKYRPQENCVIGSMYEKSFYKDLWRGNVICLRCGRKLDSVLTLLNECLSEDVVRPSMDI